MRGEDVAAQIEKIRARRDARRAERNAIEHAPLSLEEADAALVATVHATARLVRFDAAHFTNPHAAPDSALFALWCPASAQPLRPDQIAGAITCNVATDAVIARGRTDLAALYADGAPGLTRAARAAALTKHDREALADELAEEITIRAAEARGIEIPRREDVAVAVLVAHDLSRVSRLDRADPANLDLDRCRAIVDDAHAVRAVSADMADRYTDAHRDLQREETALTRLRQQRRSVRLRPGEPAGLDVIAQQEATLARARTRFERIAAERARCSAQAQLAGRLAIRVREFLPSGVLEERRSA